MKAIITGANGFVGRELTRQLLKQSDAHLLLFDIDLANSPFANNAQITLIEGQLQDQTVRQKMLDGGFDVLFHLAAVPGGTSENNPDLSRQVNLDATLDLFKEAAEVQACPRIVYSSTIAVLGAPMPEHVDDESPIVPAMTYGSHKAMVELALADLSRRGVVDSVAVRLPGIVVRPAAVSGLKSAFLSDVFHALKSGDKFICPVSAEATAWFMSVKCSAENLIHAATLDSRLMPKTRVVTLPAIRVAMGELIDAIATQTKSSADLVSFEPNEQLEEGFGRQPPLTTAAADSAGFTHDGSIDALVKNALAAI